MISTKVKEFIAIFLIVVALVLGVSAYFDSASDTLHWRETAAIQAALADRAAARKAALKQQMANQQLVIAAQARELKKTREALGKLLDALATPLPKIPANRRLIVEDLEKKGLPLLPMDPNYDRVSMEGEKLALVWDKFTLAGRVPLLNATVIQQQTLIGQLDEQNKLLAENAATTRQALEASEEETGALRNANGALKKGAAAEYKRGFKRGAITVGVGAALVKLLLLLL